MEDPFTDVYYENVVAQRRRGKQNYLLRQADNKMINLCCPNNTEHILYEKGIKRQTLKKRNVNLSNHQITKTPGLYQCTPDQMRQLSVICKHCEKKIKNNGILGKNQKF